MLVKLTPGGSLSKLIRILRDLITIKLQFHSQLLFFVSLNEIF